MGLEAMCVLFSMLAPPQPFTHLDKYCALKSLLDESIDEWISAGHLTKCGRMENALALQEEDVDFRVFSAI